MTLSMPLLCSSCPSTNPAGPAPMTATFVRNTSPPDYYRLEGSSVRAWPHVLAMIIISYNNNCKGPSKPCVTGGDDIDEENVVGALVGRQCDPCVGAGKVFRTEIVA